MPDGWFESMGVGVTVSLPCNHWTQSPWEPCPYCGATEHLVTNLQTQIARIREEIACLQYQLDVDLVKLEEILSERAPK